MAAFPVPAIHCELGPWRSGTGEASPYLRAGAAGSCSFLFCSWEAAPGLVASSLDGSGQHALDGVCC